MHRGLSALALVLCGCGDPVHDQAVAALGPEAPGVARGPYHRAGQPCLTCHGGEGPAALSMSFGGTLAAFQAGTLPATGATVRVVDARGGTFETQANCAGNFWIRERDFSPAFPVRAAVTSGNRSRVMLTQMHRDGSCNGCHSSPAAAASPGALWVLPADDPAPLQDCGLGDTRGNMPGQAGVVPACPIKSATLPGVTPSYTNDVAPLLARRCTGCHAADGEASDRPFTSRADILGKIAGTMVNFVYGCRMPPPPLPRLTDADESILVGYIEAGEPDN